MRPVIEGLLRQPITIAVGTMLAVFVGILAITRVPVRMTPEVSSVVIAVTTNWENASSDEIESDIIEEQEKVLGETKGLKSMISTSAAGQGTIRLEFETGTDIDSAQDEVLQKLDEVPGYPNGVLQPVVQDIDPESADYIAWIGLFSTDPDFNPGLLYDFMDRSVKPRFERIPGISEVGVRGAIASELQIIVDPVALAQRGVTFSQLREGISAANANFSGGKIEQGKRDFRIRATGRFDTPESARSMIIFRDEAGPVYLGDVADVRNDWKEPTSWVRSRGQRGAFFNFQLQRGANLLETMQMLQGEVAKLNEPGALLDEKARQLGLDGTLELVQTYDASTYVQDAFELVRSNLILGGVLATMTLLFFLRSLRAVGIIAIAIPVSTIASFSVLVLLGRSINIVSLAGLAFAVGMVVDNAIVVIENIFRHLEKGKSPVKAARDGTLEVGGAVLASTLTTVVVFAPILLVQEQAGQLFRDIALALMAAVTLSFIVSLTVIPVASGKWLTPHKSEDGPSLFDKVFGSRLFKILGLPFRPFGILFEKMPDLAANAVGFLTATWARRLTVITSFALITIIGTRILLPPLDYLPKGNRNLVFGLLFPPPGYNLETLSEMGERIEERISPLWEATPDKYGIETRLSGGQEIIEDKRQPVPLNDGSGGSVVPPPLDNYFLVSFEGRIFHGGISADKARVADLIPAFAAATSGTATPDTFSVAFQMPLFRVGGSTGSAVQIDFKGRDLDAVSGAAGAVMGALMGMPGPRPNITPAPPNFAFPLDEMRIVPNDERLRELEMTRSDLGLAVQAGGDGIVLFRDYEQNGELKDIKILTKGEPGQTPLDKLLDLPVASPTGAIVDLRSIASLERVRGPDQIRHVDRQRAVTLELTPPPGQPLESVIENVNALIAGMKAEGAIPPGVDVSLSGSAGKLAEIKDSLLGDGTLAGTVGSSLFLAFVVIYLLMVVLFQSWSYPLVIMLSVPLATFGGFLGLALVHQWSTLDRYMPVQNLDMLTILGFVILAGVVVNNAILIVHQALNFMREENMAPLDAIVESVRSRVRPILMSTLTSVGGMIPLVLMPGSGSELYRGLGAVVVGGLTVSTIFTVFLVPAVLSAIFALKQPEPAGQTNPEPAIA
ncbi:efflux RND transporter permease subunit [Haloferula rosea]|uniref:Efflux RND transporter permease subunit n=1 Tax=Haloferula rosea TaxID=490093 RepID=A0A934VBA1_9BACT|nr:efflux RND transporter permease subunit [Haloferula rosea]MBK1827178.1 efflux RND transporter permease subunit [Haloferula rosea]